ncbi:polyadenylate-binding protein 1 isoform X2 [Triticum aestivum]|uniref:polyadenylate-binding protein 1 isoform X2 n=1 Tax=Triticum aestivum TaxID=4565 RepID=UPI001D03500C|nr:polyadenylate-binding protein 1-like isoform X2 [Triticum aestivum]
MASGNRALPIENGEVLPAAGGNGEGGNGGSGDGFNRNRSSVDQIDDMRRRLRELEETEREMLAVAAAATHEDPAAAVTALEKAEVDARSIYVGNEVTQVQEVTQVLSLLLILPGCCDFSFLLANFHDTYRRYRQRH